MSKTAKKVKECDPVQESLEEFLQGTCFQVPDQVIFNTMRILKRVNPGDCYLENYLGMRKKYGGFLDLYHVLWKIGAKMMPQRILEIGTRTGISICQMLSAYIDQSKIGHVTCVDPFDEWTSAALVRANLKYLNLPYSEEKVTIHEIKSDEFFALEPGPFDFILVDGDHSKEQAAKDLENAHKILDPMGFLVMDDISTNPGECALVDVWDKFIEDHKKDYASVKSMAGKGVAIAIKR